MHGSLSMKALQEIGANQLTNVMDNELVVLSGGAKEPQGPLRTATTSIMKQSLETNAHIKAQTPIGLTETTTVMEPELARISGGAREQLDDY